MVTRVEAPEMPVAPETQTAAEPRRHDSRPDHCEYSRGVKSRAIWLTNRVKSYRNSGGVPVPGTLAGVGPNDQSPVTRRVPALHRKRNGQVPVECRYPARYRNYAYLPAPARVPGTGTWPALVYDMTRFVSQIARDFTVGGLFTARNHLAPDSRQSPKVGLR